MGIDRYSNPVRAGGALLVLLACPAFVNALTLEVEVGGGGLPSSCPDPRDSDDYPDIKSAIVCAQEGDEILIGFSFTSWRGPNNRDLVIDKSLTLRGSASGFGDRTTLDAQQRGRHISVVDPDVHLTLINIDFRNGLIESNVENSPASGGSISFRGIALDVVGCGFYNNSARYSLLIEEEDWSSGGAYGGAISAGRVPFVPATPRGRKISVLGSTFSDNSVYSTSELKNGAAIYFENFAGTPDDHNIALEVTTSTFHNNLLLGDYPASRVVVGGWDFDDAGKIVVTNSFISSHGSNAIPLGGFDTHVSYSSLAMFGSSQQYIGQMGGIGLTSIGTLFLGFGTTDACFVHDVGGVSLGHNLDSDGSCGLDAATDLPNVPVAHTVLRTAANGMPYIGLEPQSPAIDAGAVGCVDTLGRPVLFDQLGNARPDDSACDIGAFESPFAGQENADPAFALENYVASVYSDAGAGTLVETVAATDPDAGDALDFSIVAGNTGDTFAIDAAGAVTVANPALLTAGSDFTLSLEVSDGRGGSDSATMQIEVVQKNQPPSFIQSSYAFEIDRDSVVDAVVGNVSGTDPEGGTPTYAIVDGNADGLFAIDALTGTITVASSIAAADALHSLQIEIEDPQGLTDIATASIAIVDEPPPQPDAIFSHGFEP